MPCIRYGDAIICKPTITEQRAKIMRCPTCKKKRKFWCWFQEWYGWHVTCLACGEAWQDGEMLERPFAPGWRKERIVAARKQMEEAI